MVEVERKFDLAWARYWLKKYRKNHNVRKAELLAQLIDYQEFLGKSILGKNILIEGFFSYNLLIKVVEEDLQYKLNTPQNYDEYKKNLYKKFLNHEILIKIS